MSIKALQFEMLEVQIFLFSFLDISVLFFRILFPLFFNLTCASYSILGKNQAPGFEACFSGERCTADSLGAWEDAPFHVDDEKKGRTGFFPPAPAS